MCLNHVIGLSRAGLAGRRPLHAACCAFLSRHHASLTIRRMSTRLRSTSPAALSAVDPRPSKHVRLSSSLAQTETEPTTPASPTKMTIERAHEPRLLVQLDAAHPNARAPTRGSASAAGYDLYASESVVIPKQGGRKVVPTGIRLAIPVECYGRVAPRSGLASKHGIDVGAGVIDADYRGLLGVLLFNLGQEDFQVNAGDRIAQLVLERIMTPSVEVVESLEETVRGASGFGSTGGFGPSASEKEPSSSS